MDEVLVLRVVRGRVESQTWPLPTHTHTHTQNWINSWSVTFGILKSKI